VPFRVHLVGVLHHVLELGDDLTAQVQIEDDAAVIFGVGDCERRFGEVE
jgi:hypothetical protein